MDDLVMFLTAQLNKRQSLIMQAVKRGKLGGTVDRGGSAVLVEIRIRALGDTELDVVNRMIHEVEASRLVVAEHRTTISGTVPGVPMRGREYRCETCHLPGGEAGSTWCRTLRLLAMPYADEPGYREEWRP